MAHARKCLEAICVVQTGDAVGQQKVNKAAPEHPRKPEPIWPNDVPRPAFPSRQKMPGVHS